MRVTLVVVSAVTVGPGVAVATADGVDGHGSDLLVTFAARSCPTYTDVTANLARNDIQESLRDLGPDTPYTSGEPINPTKEDQFQPKCTPIVNWRFTFGSGIGGALRGPWGSLSYVSNPDATEILTRASTPMLDEEGRPVAGESIAGATTVELSEEQAARVASGSLWVQGGTVDDPVLNKLYPGTYGFAALRCAVDNLNGDNVERLSFPTGARHVFCYAYYVVPPPTSGTIVIRKVVSGEGGPAQSFVMRGNISYDPSGTFALSASSGQPASQTFFRANTYPGEPPWTVTEDATPGFVLTGLECTHGASTVTVDRAAARVDIALAPDDTVTCTYTNALRPTAGVLVLRKITEQGVGTFPFTVTSTGTGFKATRTITTTQAGVAAVASPIKVSPGTYKVSEGPAQGSPAKAWTLQGLRCNGSPSDGTVTIAVNSGAVCTFTNRQRHLGVINIREITRGGVGTSGFIVRPFQGLKPKVHVSETDYQKHATTKVSGQPAQATGDSTVKLPLGYYEIRQTETVSSLPAAWPLTQVVCNGQSKPFAAGLVVVRLREDRPQI